MQMWGPRPARAQSLPGLTCPSTDRRDGHRRSPSAAHPEPARPRLGWRGRPAGRLPACRASRRSESGPGAAPDLDHPAAVPGQLQGRCAGLRLRLAGVPAAHTPGPGPTDLGAAARHPSGPDSGGLEMRALQQGKHRRRVGSPHKPAASGPRRDPTADASHFPIRRDAQVLWDDRELPQELASKGLILLHRRAPPSVKRQLEQSLAVALSGDLFPLWVGGKWKGTREGCPCCP